MTELTPQERMEEYKEIFQKMQYMGVLEPFTISDWAFDHLLKAMKEANSCVMKSEDPNYTFYPSTMAFFGFQLRRKDQS
jgi:hypothetical protein